MKQLRKMILLKIYHFNLMMNMLFCKMKLHILIKMKRLEVVWLSQCSSMELQIVDHPQVKVIIKNISKLTVWTLVSLKTTLMARTLVHSQFVRMKMELRLSNLIFKLVSQMFKHQMTLIRRNHLQHALEVNQTLQVHKAILA